MKNFLIVGASSGIGRAIAEELAIGNSVFGTYCKHQLPDQRQLQYHYLDVLEPELDLSYLPETLDGIAFCPGNIALKPFARIPAADFVKDYELQVVGAVKVIQKVLPRLKLAEGASIVLFSTVAVQVGFTYHSMIAASKGAIEGLTKALAAELAPSIRVNCIAPSITDTPLAGSLLNTEEKRHANALRHPLKKIGSAADIAALSCFLLSDQSAWMTGQILHHDGGMSTIK